MAPEYRPFPDDGGRDGVHADLELPIMQRVLGLPRGGDVLEIGCGGGSGLRSLSALLAPRRLAGIDIDRAALARCEAGRETYLADARAMPFGDATFDLVFDFGTLWHIARPADALAEIARILRPGGRLVYETRLNQLASHPIRSLGRQVPWTSVLVSERETLLWSVRVKP